MVKIESTRIPVDGGPHCAVHDLVIGSGIEFEDRREHEMKGVPGTWKLFAVAG